MIPLRIEAGASIELRAQVEDDETAVDRLELAWKAEGLGGVFSNVAATPTQVRWVAPSGQSPREFAFSLAVTERWDEIGVSKSQQVTAISPTTHYNDSPAEILRIATRFITELFSNFSVTPQQAVQDFSDSCPGKQRELEDVRRNRDGFRILSGTYSNVVVRVNSDRTRGEATGVCVFRDIPNSGSNAGRTQRIEGICHLTAIYERWNWYLCDSSFDLISGPTRESLRFRVPGFRE